MQIQVKMKVDRSIDSVNECEQWRKYYKFINNSSYGFVQNMTTGWTGASNSGTGVVFCLMFQIHLVLITFIHTS